MSSPRSLSSLTDGAPSDLRLRRRPEQTEDEEGGASERSSSEGQSPGMLRDTPVLPVEGVETDELRWCKVGMVDRVFVVDGLRVYASEDGALRCMARKDGDGFRGASEAR